MDSVTRFLFLKSHRWIDNCLEEQLLHVFRYLLPVHREHVCVYTRLYKLDDGHPDTVLSRTVLEGRLPRLHKLLNEALADHCARHVVVDDHGSGAVDVHVSIHFLAQVEAFFVGKLHEFREDSEEGRSEQSGGAAAVSIDKFENRSEVGHCLE